MTLILRIAVSAVLSACSALAAELPPVEALKGQMGAPAGAVAVYEPHLSVGDRHVAIRYVGYPAVDVFERILGKGWQNRAGTVEFRALDGYVSRLPVRRFLKEKAYLVFARQNGAPFTVDNVQQNERDVPLAPYYLVWDNVSNPALIAEGARNWPYQVTEVTLVTLSDAALLPKGLPPRHREGAALVKTHCLNCHKVNGFGGEKFEGNLAEIARDFREAEFLRLLLVPASERGDSTMPSLSDRLPEAERRRIAGAILEYLRAVPVLP
ncbi:MAG: cytochrome c [Rhodospirillaceae bacterium]|nr:cytochrome c [Rhodospirillaceae bacterium]